VADRNGGGRVVWTPGLESARKALETRLGPGDVLVTVGAGDVYRLAEAIVAGGGVDGR